MTFNILLLTGEQIRAARALARIEQTELARRATLSLETIKRLERIRGPVEANARTLRSIQRAFEAIGISFHGDDAGMVGITHHPTPLKAGQTATSIQPIQLAPVPVDRLRRLIYHGRLKAPQGAGLRSALANLHSQTLGLGRDLGLTGLTLVLDGVVLQAIEGEHQAVETALKRLKVSSHHEDFSLMDDRSAGQRVFSAMDFSCGLFDQDRLLNAEDSPPSLPFEAQHLTATQAIAILMSARRRQDKTPRKGCMIPSACNLSSQCLEHRCSGRAMAAIHDLNPEVQ